MEDILEIKRKMYAEKVEQYKSMCGKIKLAIEDWVRTLAGCDGYVTEPYIDYDDYRENDFEVRVEVSALTKDDERIKKGFKYDFGSGTDLYINSKEIKVSHGSIGTYSRENKGQLFRDTFLCHLWESEFDVINDIKGFVDIDLLKALKLLCRELDTITRERQAQQVKEENNRILNELKKSKYLCGFTTRYDWDTSKNYEYYAELRKIIKVTDKTVMTIATDKDGNEYPYSSTKREKLSEVISLLKFKKLITTNTPLSGKVPTKEE